MILCGERISAATAERIGLVEEIVPRGESLEKALALAAQVGEQSPMSVSVCKELIHSARNTSINFALSKERESFVDLFDSEDQKEGVQAFLEKRQPEWQNR